MGIIYIVIFSVITLGTFIIAFAMGWGAGRAAEYRRLRSTYLGG